MTQEELKLVLDALKWCHGGEPCGTAEAIAVVEKALAQPKQVIQDRTCSITLRLQGKPYPRTCKKCGLGPCIAQPTAQPEQEPDYKLLFDELAEKFALLRDEAEMWKKQALFRFDATATPPQRTWVGLEGEEIRNLWEEATKPDRSTMTMVTSFARVIESKLKELNT